LLFFTEKFWVFSFFSFFRFFGFFNLFRNSLFRIVSLLYRNREFRLNQNKQKTHPYSLKESIFGNFSANLGLFRFVTKQICLFRLFQYRFETPKQIKFFLFGYTKQTETNAKQILFRFEPKFIFVCFEDTLTEGMLPYPRARAYPDNRKKAGIWTEPSRENLYSTYKKRS
jgi:hypothetical protein